MRRLHCLWVLTLACGFAPISAAETDVIPPPLAPLEALTTFVLPEGFDIELVAAEPLVRDPIAIAWGADGKLWVVEMGDYPLGVDGKGSFGGNVKFLVDDDGDGRYDRATTFLPGLPFPTGVLPWGKGVIVSAAPEIFYAEDRDGDGQAEVRETLIRGLAEGNQQHRVNGLRLGLDNWIHCANGDSGGLVEAVKSGVKLNLGRRDFRFRVDDGRLEPVTGQTQFGLDMDDWGHWFGSSNSRPLTHYVLPDHYLRRNPHAIITQTSREVPEASGAAPVFPASRTLARFNDLNKVNRFTSACGGTIYRDELLGVEFIGNSFVCEPVHNLVHREVLEPQGTSFVSRRAPGEQRSEFVASTDVWFRPVMARTGPDGALWIVDMYRAVVEHPEWIPKDWQAKLDLRAGQDRGRIYRVYREGHEPRATRALGQLPSTDLVDMLLDPSGTVRDQARQLILEHGDRSLIPQVRALAIRSSTAQSQVQALSILTEWGDMRESMIAQLLRDPLAQVRIATLRALERMLKLDEPGELEWITELEDLRHCATHTDAQLRLQTALALGELNATAFAKRTWRTVELPQVGELLAEIAIRDHTDPWITAAVASSLHADNLASFTQRLLSTDVPPLQRAAIREAWINTVVGLDHRPALQTLLAWLTRGEALQLTAEASQAVQTLLDQLDRDRRTLDDLAAADSSAVAKLQAILARAGKTVADDKVDLGERIAAIGLLGRIATQRHADEQQLIALLSPTTPNELRDAALASLARIGDRGVAVAVLAHWSMATPGLRTQVVDLLLGRETWIEPLFLAIEQGQLRPQDLNATQRQRLTQHRAPKIRDRAAAVLATVQNTPRAQLVEQFQDVLQLTGDRERGRQVFGKRCAACHKLGEVGHPIGPDLMALTDKSPRSLLVALLDPNRAVEAKYLTYTAVTTAGVTHTGMLVDESGGSITLLAGENKRVTLVRSEIDEFAGSTKSLMPEGLEKDVTRQEIADLLAMLGELRAPRKTFAGNAPVVVKPESLRGEFWLLATQAEIYGSTLVYEPTFQNLGYWQSADDHAAWMIDIPTAGKFELSFEYAVPGDSAGSVAHVAIGDQRLSVAVKSTGGWETFGTATLGNVTLPVGEQRVVVCCDGKPAKALFDLKSVRLRPVR
ncbi:MAG: c-type cytochrome [Planctomycetaceae bacterium]|nr:c-type cytochrome [Planctomycetaceae bacterium]